MFLALLWHYYLTIFLKFFVNASAVQSFYLLDVEMSGTVIYDLLSFVMLQLP